MSMKRSALVAVTLALAAGATLALAADISTKKMSIKDNTNPARRQVQVQSKDPAVMFSAADDPGTNGAAVHVYSATDDFCVTLAGGAAWKNKGTSWKYADKLTKNGAQVKDGKLSVKIKSGVTFTLADN